jgi:hypothetical protein
MNGVFLPFRLRHSQEVGYVSFEGVTPSEEMRVVN